MMYLRKSQELTIRHVTARLFAGGRLNYSSDYGSSDDERQNNTKENIRKLSRNNNAGTTNEESASAKLNRLLASMQTADDRIHFVKRTGTVTKVGEANKKKKLQQKQEAESRDIFTAAKKVASLLRNERDQQQTESELLSRLLGGKSATVRSSGEKKTSATGSSSENEVSLSDLIVGMKIDRHQHQKELIPTRSDYVRRSIVAKGKQQKYKKQDEHSKEKYHIQRKREPEIYTGSVNLFGGEPLGIYTDYSALKDSTDLLPTWSYLQAQSLKTQISHPPSNYFEKLANWTEQGKVWRFPIDNEQDWLEEKDVDFSQHIFLEQHLLGWCPNRGPIRHFMELVCVGLSKNPYITAGEKKDHIMWYRDYFESKKDILNDLMSRGNSEKTITS